MMSQIEQEIRDCIREATKKAAKSEWTRVQAENNIPSYDYRFNHVQEVVRISKILADSVNADITVVTLGAWLHDVAKPGLGGKDRHGVEGAKIARRILQERGIDDETIGKVCDVINKHVGLTLDEQLQPIEAQVVWEADKLVKLGMTGFIHHLINGIKLRPGRSLVDFARDLQDFIPLATKIAGSMHTELGQQMARERLETLKEMSKRLENELGL